MFRKFILAAAVVLGSCLAMSPSDADAHRWGCRGYRGCGYGGGFHNCGYGGFYGGPRYYGGGYRGGFYGPGCGYGGFHGHGGSVFIGRGGGIAIGW